MYNAFQKEVLDKYLKWYDEQVRTARDAGIGEIVRAPSASEIAHWWLTEVNNIQSKNELFVDVAIENAETLIFFANEECDKHNLQNNIINILKRTTTVKEHPAGKIHRIAAGVMGLPEFCHDCMKTTPNPNGECRCSYDHNKFITKKQVYDVIKKL